MPNKVKDLTKFYSSIIRTYNFDFEVKITLGLKVRCKDGYIDRIELFGPSWLVWLRSAVILWGLLKSLLLS